MKEPEEIRINKSDVYQIMEDQGFEPLELDLASKKETVYNNQKGGFIDLIVQDKSLAFKNVRTNKGKFLLFDDDEIEDKSYLDAFSNAVCKLV